ncbi:unnamed protein product [Oncorhynchus mykiss]|uniref:Uncharacterized protein n=1 Tax=Oncorhynchus mykiss TaxID=8022 RepID=A0A060XZE5_ONCMY|nr:unnamed protein product [Oncorhynchus mykiss]
MRGMQESMWVLPLVLLGLLKPWAAGYSLSQVCDPSEDGTIYNYKAKTLNGSRSVSLSEYMGKTVLFPLTEDSPSSTWS